MPMTDSAPKTAMMLAAGLGKRMRPLTNKIPKPLITIGGRALIDYAIDHSEKVGVKNIVINIHHLGNQIVRHLSNRKDLNIIFSDETKELLETGGGIVNALSHLGNSPFFVINGDVLWVDGPKASLHRLAQIWNDETMDGLLLLHSTVESYGYEGFGDFLIDPNGILTRRPELLVSPYVYTGIQLLHPRFFKDVPNGPFSINQLYSSSIEKGRLYGIIHDGEWFHVGTPIGLNQAEVFFQERFPGLRHR